MTALSVAAMLWPFVVVLLGLILGRLLRRADDGPGRLTRRPGARSRAATPPVPVPSAPERAAGPEPAVAETAPTAAAS